MGSTILAINLHELDTSNTVTRIIDGDTIVVDKQSIRFALASAPELTEPGGIEARTFIEEICPVGSKVTIDEDDGQKEGSFGRVLAKITCNGISLNQVLVEQGYGIVDKRFCNESEFKNEEWTGCKKSTSTPPPSTPATETTQSSCDPSYPDVCIPPPPPDLDCGEISHRNFIVLPPDPHRFDGDKDGIGCES